MVFTVSSPMQVALGIYTEDPSAYLTLPAFYQEKHDFLYEGLKQTRFKPIRSQGTFFLLADYSEISQKRELKVSMQHKAENFLSQQMNGIPGIAERNKMY